MLLRNRRKGILADDVGLGKTVQGIAAAQTPCLIVAPSRAIGVWESELRTWIPHLDENDVVRYVGHKIQRQKIAREIKESKRVPKFLICTYSMMREVQDSIARYWKTIIYDEAHIMRNRQQKAGKEGSKVKGTLYPTAKRFISLRTYMLTATPVVNGAQDLWTLLNLLYPSRFSSYWRFVNEFCIVEDNGFGKKVVGTNPRTAKKLQAVLSEIMIKRTAEDVGLELPDKTRQFVPLEMAPTQAKFYRQIALNMLLELENDQLLLVPNELAKITRLRQLLVTPQLLGQTEPGIALETLAEDVEGLNEPIVVFTPFAQAFPYVRPVLEKAGFLVHEIRGGMDDRYIAAHTAQFRAGGKQAILATIQSGTSWSASGCRLAFNLGFEWRPTDHDQAEGRLAGGLRRTVPVFVKYYTHEHTIDQHLLGILSQKVTWQQLATDPKKLLLPD